MTLPPLPPNPTLRIRFGGTNDVADWGSRFYVLYSGTTPSGATLNTIATDIATAWNTDLAAFHNADLVLTTVEVEDITTLTGASGQAVVSHVGTRSGTALPQQIAANVQFLIARRYRGGKPRMYLPAGVDGDLQDQAHWSPTFATNLQAALGTFIGAVSALTVSGTAVGAHINLNYYHSFTNVTNTSGRTRAAPKYINPGGTLPSSSQDLVTDYRTALELSSQRRRRIASTI